MYKLVRRTGGRYFLSRPRRFGKSLLVSTLESFYKGKRELFRGLAIDSLIPGEWPCREVLHIDFNLKKYDSAQSLHDSINRNLVAWEKEYGANESEKDLTDRFGGVI